MRITSISRQVIDSLSMLSLIARDHIDRLLQNIEIEILISELGREVKIPVDERLCTGIKERINVSLVPSLFVTTISSGLVISANLTDFIYSPCPEHRILTKGLLACSFTVTFVFRSVALSGFHLNQRRFIQAQVKPVQWAET